MGTESCLKRIISIVALGNVGGELGRWLFDGDQYGVNGLGRFVEPGAKAAGDNRISWRVDDFFNFFG